MRSPGAHPFYQGQAGAPAPTTADHLVRAGPCACPYTSGRRDLNPRPQPWQGCALPTELLPHFAPPSGHPLLQTAVLPSGAKGDRTPDLLNAIQALYQLSYRPKTG